MREGTRARTASRNSEGPNNDWRKQNAAHGTRLVNGPPSESSSSSATPSNAVAGSDAASASNVVAGEVAQDAGNMVAVNVAQDAAQDTVVSGGAGGRRTSPHEKEDDEDRAKGQRTEKKAELEMEVSSVAKIKDSRRILDLRRDGWELEYINHRDAAMFCACELRPRVIQTQLE